MKYLPLCLLLTACVSPALPGIEVRTVEVVRETMKPCPADKPARPEKVGRLPTNAVDAVYVLSAKLLEWSGPGGYGDKADAALTICKSE